MNGTIYIHIVESDDDPRAICTGEPFDISKVKGDELVQLCPDCEELASEELDDILECMDDIMEGMDDDVPNDAD